MEVLDVGLDDGCPHNNVKPDPDDPDLEGVCEDCGERGFPIFHEYELERADRMARNLWDDVIDRLVVVPVCLQPKERTLRRWKRMLLETDLEVPMDPEGDFEGGLG